MNWCNTKSSNAVAAIVRKLSDFRYDISRNFWLESWRKVGYSIWMHWLDNATDFDYSSKHQNINPAQKKANKQQEISEQKKKKIVDTLGNTWIRHRFFHQCTTECKLLREVQQLSCIRNRFVACQERMTERITICIRHSCVHITTVRHCGNPRLYVTGPTLTTQS